MPVQGKKHRRKYDKYLESLAKRPPFGTPSKKKSYPNKMDNYAIVKQTAKKPAQSIREAFAVLVCKQYLPFSIVGEEVLQQCFITFLNEYMSNKVLPDFVTDKTVAADISKMADQYIEEVSKRFSSKLSLCMDVWTGPNKMSFLGITFTYLDENFHIQRGLLHMVKMKQKHSGE
jgi:hypothetical protein